MWFQSSLRARTLLSAPVFKSKHLSAIATFFSPGSAALLSEPNSHRFASDEDEQHPKFCRFHPQKQELDSVKVGCILRSFKGDPDAAFSFFDQLTKLGFLHDIYTYSAVVTVLCRSSGLRDKLDSVKVGCILRSFKGDPDAAFSFFDQLTKLGFLHDIYTYSAVVTVLCRSSGLRDKLDFVLLQLISSESEDFDVFDLLDYLSREVRGERVVRVFFDALVKVYVIKGMFEEAIDALFRTKRRGFFPHVFTCNFLLNRLIDHGKPQMAVSLYLQLKKLGVQPNDYMYTIVIKALCKKGDLEEAAEVFKDMEVAGVTPNTFAYTTYIEGLCVNRRSNLAYQVLKAWQGANVRLDVYAYGSVIQGLCDEMMLERAEQVLIEMEEQDGES